MSIDTQQDEVAVVVFDEWCAALDVTGAADGDNFFTMGGNSLLAVDFVGRVEDRLGIKFPLETLFVKGTYGPVLAECRARAAK